jgi:GAF domain-containing protein
VNLKTIQVWLVSSDGSLVEKVRRVIQSNSLCELTYFLGFPDSSEIKNQSPVSIVLVDSRNILFREIITFRARYKNSEFILFYDKNENSDQLSWNYDNGYTFLPIQDHFENLLLQTLRLMIDNEYKSRTLLSIAQTTSQISEARSTKEVMQITCEAIVKLLNVDHSGFVQFDDDQRHGWALTEYPEIGSRGILINVNGIPAEMKVVYEGKPFFSADVTNDDDLKEISLRLTEKGIKSILIIPVRVGERVTASFSLDMFHQQDEIEQETIDLCVTLADQVGIALKNIRTREDIEFMRQAFDAIQQIAQKSAQGEFHETLQSIVDLACEKLNVDNATLYTYDNERNRFIVGVGSGYSKTPIVPPTNFLPSSTPFRLLKSNNEYEKTEDAPHDLIFSGGFVNKESILSSFGMKIMSDNEVVGVLFINFRGPMPHHFRDEEIKTYCEFGNLAAVIIRNAELRDQIKKQLMALEGLYSVGESMPEYELENSLKRIVDQALPVVGIDDPALGLSHVAVLTGDTLEFLVASSADVLQNLNEKAGKVDIRSQTSRIGIVGKAILEDRTLNIGDVKTNPDYSKYYIESGPDINSQMTVILHLLGRVFGTLTVESEDPHAFSEEARRNLEHLAHHAEMALLSARHFSFIKTLLAAGEKLTSDTRLSSVLEDIGDKLRNFFGCNMVSIFTLSPQDKLGFPAIISGTKLHPEVEPDYEVLKANPKRIPFERIKQPVLPKLRNFGEPLFCDQDASADPILGSGDFVIRENIVAVAAIPLRSRHDKDDRIVGFLFLNYRQLHVFTQQERNEIIIFAQNLAHAIDYYQQYDELLEVRGTIGGINVVTWMDDYSERWMRLVRDRAAEIKRNVYLLKQQLDNPSASLFPEREEYLIRIKDLADQISKNTVPPRPHQAGYREKECNIDRMLRKIVTQYKGQTGLPIKYRITAPKDILAIKADQEWLWHGFVNLIEYSIESMNDSDEKAMEIEAGCEDNRIRVLIMDTGRRPLPCDAAISSQSRDQSEDVFRFRLQAARAIFALYDGQMLCRRRDGGGAIFEIIFTTG